MFAPRHFPNTTMIGNVCKVGLIIFQKFFSAGWFRPLFYGLNVPKIIFQTWYFYALEGQFAITNSGNYTVRAITPSNISTPHLAQILLAKVLPLYPSQKWCKRLHFNPEIFVALLLTSLPMMVR